MRSEWKKTTWGDLSVLKYGKGLKDYKEKVEGVPVFGTNGRIGYTEKALSKGPGIIIGRKGAYRGVQYTDSDFYVIDTAYYLEPKKSDLNLKWAYYDLLSKDLNSLDSGSAIPSTKKEDFYAIETLLPPIQKQNGIVRVLDCISNKIELNNNLISNLEDLAVAIFKRWFVDFEFPNENGNPYKTSGGKMVESELGEIPNGWKVKSLSEIANYKNGLAMQRFRPVGSNESLPVLKIKELNQGYTDLASDRCSVDINEDVKVFDGDVIFSWSGTLLVKLWTGGNAGLNQHLFKVSSEKFEKWFYFLWTKYYLNQFISIARDKATTMGHIKRENLNSSKVCFSSDGSVMRRFNDTFTPLINKIIELGLENNNLKDAREVLLPKLLSGELEV